MKKGLIILLVVGALLVTLYALYAPASANFTRPASAHVSLHASAHVSLPAYSQSSLPFRPINCSLNATKAFLRIFTLLSAAGVRLILFEDDDLLQPTTALTRALNNATVISRYIILGEELEALERALADIASSCENDSLETRRNLEEGVVVNVFFIVALPTPDGVLTFAPYRPWKRLHLRVMHRRGGSSDGAGYRWMARENDDEGRFKLDAEAFREFSVKPVASLERGEETGMGFFLPKDVAFFAWQRKASSFKICEKRVTVNCTKPKCLPSVDEEEIHSFMRSIDHGTRLMADLRLRAYLSCGNLLGWYRQCSIIPGDRDIDLELWSSFDLYPEIVRSLEYQPIVEYVNG